MPPELSVTAAFVLAALVTLGGTPIAIRAAHATGYLDRPGGYKRHGAPTPYLGGAAIMAGVLAGGLVFAVQMPGLAIVVAFCVILWALGTLDDRRSLSPLARILVHAGVGVGLFASGQGWDIAGGGAVDLALTVAWVVGIVNGVNLMDNMNGSAATTTAISVLGAGAIALLTGADSLAALCFAVGGACFAFLHFNLPRPSRIFMGDGGSTPLGFLLAFVAMQTAMSSHGGMPALLVAGLLAGLVIFDTTLVVISRARRRAPVLSGGNDHLTHRLATRLGTPIGVAVALGVVQSVLSVSAIAAAHYSGGWLPLLSTTAIAIGLVSLWVLEKPAWSRSVDARLQSPRDAAPARAHA